MAIRVGHSSSAGRLSPDRLSVGWPVPDCAWMPSGTGRAQAAAVVVTTARTVRTRALRVSDMNSDRIGTGRTVPSVGRAECGADPADAGPAIGASRGDGWGRWAGGGAMVRR